MQASPTPGGTLGSGARSGAARGLLLSQFSKQLSTHIAVPSASQPPGFQDPRFSAERITQEALLGNGWRRQGRWEGGIKDALGDVGVGRQASTPSEKEHTMRGGTLPASLHLK